MADFKIKSASGTGNKLLIKGQNQDVTDSSYAIQIGDSGASTLHNATITAGVFPTGMVIQCLQKTDTDNGTFDSSSYTNTIFDNLNFSITPKYSTSKILVTVNVSMSHQNNDTGHIRLVRDPTGTPVPLAVGPADGSSTSATFSIRSSGVHSIIHQTINYLDSPGVDTAVTYGLQGFTSGSQAGVFGYNQPEEDSTTDPNHGRHMSIITLMEIAQ